MEIEVKSALAKLKLDKGELQDYKQGLILGREKPKDKDGETC